MRNLYQIYLISDSTGETIENTVSDTISQFHDVNRKEYFWPMTRTEDQIKDISTIEYSVKGSLSSPELKRLQ